MRRKIDPVVKLVFDNVSYYEQSALIRNFDTEVAWQGTVEKIRNMGEIEYHIKKIYVYPQNVSDVTAMSDRKEYQEWIFDMPDEEFNKLHLQAHSHVNMSVSPSVTDSNTYRKISSQLEKDMFYIFMIWNKRQQYYIRIVDNEEKRTFNNENIQLVVGENSELGEFIEDAKRKVKV